MKSEEEEEEEVHLYIQFAASLVAGRGNLGNRLSEH